MLIYAHRGASADFPEHTMAAYEAAVSQGADGFECDVRITKDEIPVLWHNSSMLERAGNRGIIAEMTYEEVARAYPQVLTLDALLDFAMKNRKGMLIETKHPVISGNRVEELIVEMLDKKKALQKIPVTVMSFSWSAVEKLKRLNPEISSTFLLHKFTPWFQIKYSSATSIGPEIDELRTAPIKALRIKDSGRSLNVWTVDDDADIKLCERLGVEILITNKPEHAREVLRYP
ncbi:MAG: glycerophosphodiester phosphodiesterase family protein [Actinobacteria bacterium]|jgi:glycerophosphoryl diester phosphodiesterase|nr:glycerophosphodiester phosphodiesterase family protein [Actinomycetota bacterium]